MSIAKIYKHYKITPNKFKELLGANGIDVDLRFLKEIPEEWLNLLTKETGIEKLKLEVEPAKNYSSNVKVVQEKNTDVKENLLTIKNKLSNESDARLAYVKFVANDKSHAFVKVIDDLKTIHNEVLSDKTDNNLRIDNECEQLDFDQVILIKPNGNKKTTVLLTTRFDGYFKLTKRRNYNNSSGPNTHFIKSFFHIINKGIKNVIEVKNGKNEIPYQFISKELFFQRRSFIVKDIDLKLDSNNYLLDTQIEVNEIIQNEILDENARDIIEFYKKNAITENFENLLKKQFDKDVSNKNYFTDENQVKLFLIKWLYLDKNWVNITNLENTSYWSYYYKLWLENKLLSTFWEDKIIEATIKYIEENEEKNHELLIKKTITFRNKILFAEPLILFLKSNFIINSLEQLNILKLIISNVFSNDITNYSEVFNEKLSDELKLKLWNEKNSVNFPKDYAISIFNNADEELQKKIINELDVEEIVSLIQFAKPNNDNVYQLKLLEASIKTIDAAFETICFDLETDTKTIYEIAWKKNQVNFNYNSGNTSAGIEAFKKIVELKQNTFVGHNIVDFDCVELKKFAIEFENNLIWDTLLIEMILSPELKKYALKTKHKASADVELTLKLFYNQIARILAANDNELESLYQYLDGNIIDKINKLKEDYSWNWISNEIINNDKLTFFRPQPNNNKIVDIVNHVLNDEKNKVKIIIVPDGLKKSLYNLENVNFYSTLNKKEFGIINIEKIQKLPSNFSWIKACLENYYNYKINRNQIPYWGDLATAIKIKVENDIDVFSIVSFKENLSEEYDSNTIVNCNEFYTIKGYVKTIKDVEVYIVNEKELLLENKTCLKIVDLSELISSSNKNQFWLKFTGGVSYVEINKNDCLNLRIEIPENFDNFWIEKQDYNNFKIWGNFNFEKIIEDNFKNNHTLIDLIENKNETSFVYYPKLKIASNANEQLINFNPETNYRSRYWLFQKEIIDHIIDHNHNSPNLLVVQNENEVNSLELYFRHLDFYIPSNDASLARRMELLHNNKVSKKIMIIPIKDYDRALNLNYLDSLNIIIESLKLFENFFITKNTSLFTNNFDEDFNENLDAGIDQSEENEIDEDQNIVSEIKKPLFKDIYFHLKLQTPFVKYLKNNAFENYTENELWILDPRINDYNEISEEWGAKSRPILIGDKMDFEQQLKVIEMFITGPKPLKELPFDLERTKEILSNLFLDGKPWYKEQIPYLDDIIPAKTDLLITLPTGGGKSLLFQGPAILRSSFTNKLTIVVTPLKALMQDQVEALWEKGFYGCVEYLNSDRGTDTKIIYRAIAGGEVSLLFVTPERFRSSGFKKALSVRLKADGGLEYAVFDEAHCVSQWGHEFRPDYFNGAKEINNIKKMANEEFPLLLFSATVSKKIYEDFNTIFS